MSNVTPASLMSDPSTSHTRINTHNVSLNNDTNNNNHQRQEQLASMFGTLPSPSSMVPSSTVGINHKFENDQFSQIYSVISSDTVSLETKTELVKAFKGHIKKEFINTKLTQLYLDALLLVPKKYPPTEDQQKIAINLILLAHSTLCYLIKRISIQIPEHLNKGLVDALVPYLIDTQNTIQISRNQFVDGHFIKKFWLLTIRIFETLYTVCSILLEKALQDQLLLEADSSAKLEFAGRSSCINHIKLILLASNELCGMKKRKVPGASDPSLLLREFFPTWVSLLNKPVLVDSEDLSTICELMFDIIKRNSNKQILDMFVVQLNDRAKAIFLNLESQAEDLRRESLDNTSIAADGNVFDVAFELEQIQRQSVIPHLSNSINTGSNTTKSTQCASIHNLLTEFMNLLVPFHDQKETEQNWRIRQKNTILMHERLISNKLLIHGNKSEFISTLKQINFIEYISRGALSLRTTLSLNTCQLIKCLIELLGDDLSSNLLDQIFGIFKVLLSSTKKISSQIAYHCLITMLIDIGFHTKLFQNCFLLINEKNVLPRNTSAVLLRIFIIKFNSSAKLDTNLIYINEWLKKGISDAQTTVRESMRLTFWYFYKAYPDRAKELLSSAFSTHLKKAIELSIPEHLNIDYKRQYRTASSFSPSSSSSFPMSTQLQQQQRRTSLLSTSTASSASSSRRSSLLNTHNVPNTKRKYPSYAQPRNSSTTIGHLKNQASSIRSSSDSLSKGVRPLALADEHLTNKRLRTDSGETLLHKRKISAPPPLGTMDDTQQFDLTEELSATSSMKLINKYMVTTADVNTTPSDFQTFSRMFDAETSYKQSLALLQGYLLRQRSAHNGSVEENFEKLLPKLRHIFVKYPVEVRDLLTIGTFVKHLPLNYMLELYAINKLEPTDLLSILNVSNLEEFNSLTEGISILLTDLMSTHVPELTIYYMKYRSLMFDFTMNLLLISLTQTTSPLPGDILEKLQNKDNSPELENILVSLFGIEGGEFDTRLYYDLLFACYKLNNTVFLSSLKSLSFISIKLKTTHELQQRDPSFELDEIISSSREVSEGGDSQIGPVKMASDEEDFDVKRYMEMTMVNPFNHPNKNNDRITFDDADSAKREYDNDTINPKLYEMTKVVSVYQDLKPSSPTSEEETLKSENGLDLKAIFENDENSENKDEPVKSEIKHAVKFASNSPELIVGSSNIKEESVQSDTVTEEIKVDDSVRHITESPHTEIKTEDSSRVESLEALHDLENTESIDDTPYTILGEFRSSVFTYYEISKLLSQINISGLREHKNRHEYEFEHMMRGITRIKEGAFAIKHINYLIEPLITFSPRSARLISWLEEEDGYNKLLEISYMLLQSFDDSSLVPNNIIRKSVLLVQCVLVVNKIQGNHINSLDPSTLSSIWSQMIIIASKLQENIKDIPTLVNETRDTLASLDFFTSKRVTYILSVLVSELPEDVGHNSEAPELMTDVSATQNGAVMNSRKVTFLLKTLASILKLGSLELKKLQMSEIIQTLSFLIGSKNTEWAFNSTYVLSEIFRKLVRLDDVQNSEFRRMFSCLDTGHFELVKIMASFGGE